MPQEPVISIRDLSHAFGEGALRREVLHRISADFYSGEIVIIMGPSGAGKTTVLTLAGALRAVQEGSVLVGGKELKGLGGGELARVRRRIGFIFQAHNLIESLTACQNVQLALAFETGAASGETREPALRMLAEVGLGDHAHKKPGQLSGGQKQRVAIARALVRNPDIVMADEPTASLDRKTGREVVDILHRLARRAGCTILLVTHDNRILDIADRILKIEDGLIEEMHLGLERLGRKVADLVEAISRCIACVGEAGSRLEALRGEFAELAESLDQELSGVAYRNQKPAVVRRVGLVKELLAAARSLDGALAKLLGLLGQEPARAVPGLCNAMVQALEFLLLTAVDALKAGETDEADTLLLLTGSRNEMMAQLRGRYQASLDYADEELGRFLFDLTTTCAVVVHLLGALAGRWREWLDGREAAVDLGQE